MMYDDAMQPVTDPPEWDLTALFSGPDDPRIQQTTETVETNAAHFAARYQGNLATLSPSELGEAFRDYENIEQEAAKPMAFANLRFAAASSPESGAFLQAVRQSTTRATLPLLFFPLELQSLPAARLDELIRSEHLAPFRYFLETLRAGAAFRLSLPEERILEETANTGKRALVRLYEETTSRLRFTLPGGEDNPLSLPQILDKQSDPDRAVRQSSADALTRGLETQADTLTFLFNTLIQSKATEDRLRGHTFPEQARHLANDLSDSVVETVVQTAEAGYGLVARFYEAKRGLLHLPHLAHYDRYAPLPSLPGESAENIPFVLAREQVMSAFRAFDNQYADAAQAFFDNEWIDAKPRTNKRGGAFCAFVTPDTHPVIFCSYLNKSGDVKTLAHELGHGIHSYLSRQNGYLTYHGTLPLAEVASTFAEMLVFDANDKNGSPHARLAALSRHLDQSVATVFRQAALHRFEQALHRERQNGELTTARISALWQEKVGAMFAGSVVMEPGHGLWWSYVRHFIATPFYVYAYTFGEMLALALFRKYQTEGKNTFAPAYLDFLKAGGSKSPQDLMTPLGVRLDDPTFWHGALHVLEAEIAEFEVLAAVQDQTPR